MNFDLADIIFLPMLIAGFVMLFVPLIRKIRHSMFRTPRSKALRKHPTRFFKDEFVVSFTDYEIRITDTVDDTNDLVISRHQLEDIVEKMRELETLK